MSKSRMPDRASSSSVPTLPPKVNGVVLDETFGCGWEVTARGTPNCRTVMSVPKNCQGACSKAARVIGAALASANNGISRCSGSKVKYAASGGAAAGIGGRGRRPMNSKDRETTHEETNILDLIAAGGAPASLPITGERWVVRA